MANLPTQLNNPGDLKDPTTGQLRQFASPQEGWLALTQDISAKQKGATSTGLTGDSTIQDFAHVWAPASDKNDPVQYASNISSHLGVTPDSPIGSIHPRDLATAVAKSEGYQGEPLQSMSLKDFGSKIQSKYWQYANLNPEDVAKKVLSKYPQYEGLVDTSIQEQPSQESQEAGTTKEQSLSEQLQERNKQIQHGIERLKEGTVEGGFSGALQTLGGALGGAGDIVTKGLESIPLVGSAVKVLESLAGKAVQGVASTPGGQGAIKSWTDFAQAHPEAASDISSLGTIVSSIPVFKGFGAVKNLGEGALTKVLAKRELANIVSDVAPKETASTLAKGIAKRGTTKSLLTGRISIPIDPAIEKLATIVSDNVPGFSKVKTLAEKINLTQDATDAMARDLKNKVIESGSDRIYPIRELESAINKAPEPISLKGTPFEKQIAPLKKAALQIARNNGGTISSLFDAEKEFDALVRKTYPNLWDRENAPMRDAVRAVRDAMGNYINDNLPKEVGFKQSRFIQHNLLNAVRNMSEKAASGVEKEIGTTRLQRFGMRHPLIRAVAKKGGKYALEAAGLGAGVETARRFFNE